MIGISGGTGRLVRLQQARVGGLERQSVLSSPSALLRKGFFICLTWKSKKCNKSELHSKCLNLAWRKPLKLTGLEIACHRTTALAVVSSQILLSICRSWSVQSRKLHQWPLTRPEPPKKVSWMRQLWGHGFLFPKRQGSDPGNTALDDISVPCRACHLIPPHLGCLPRKGWPCSRKSYGERRDKYPSWLQGWWERNKANVGSEGPRVGHPQLEGW